ncbi:nitric oxide synthase [Rheinheimera sp. D18]|uniref:PepSY domain-containing protein n=1 Tax=Rheinheimera sp. D18 TaxID=2545632 RepID=UPI00104C3A81|nr:PepSY domain-containing protein [Rheinheimera sp. D18]QBL10471.1 nitric oxide synthase [Rheinheimera sp. D18]
MLRQLHSLSGLIAGMFLIILSITAVILSLNPALERAGAVPHATGQISVAELAGKVAQHFQGVEQIERKASGRILVYYTHDNQVGIDFVDPRTGQAIAPYQQSASVRWIKSLHRSLLLDTTGRAIVGIIALIMVILTLSGVMLLATRLGGYSKLLLPVRGTLSQRLHLELSRIAVVGLFISALTGTYLCATTFGLITANQQSDPELPAVLAAGLPSAINTLWALQATDINNLRELVYPYPDDSAGMYSLTTDQGTGYVDQVSGAWLSYQANNVSHTIYEFIYMLHTGEGLWWLGILLGLTVLTVPIIAITGVIIWWTRLAAKPKLTVNSSPNSADSVILVGSESNSTWGFAKALHDSLVKTGHCVHTAPMNQLAKQYPSAKRLFMLTSTYGDGDAPASANQFLSRLTKVSQQPTFAYAVLGFGDRQYPHFCGFAKNVEDACIAKGWKQLLPLETIDRQSPQEFARWGAMLSKAIAVELTLVYTPVRPKTTQLELVERINYGTEVQSPTAVLRFKTPENARKLNIASRLLHRNSLPHFEAGDLVGIFPPNSDVPRFYSLASASKDGILEICVRLQHNGLCSNFLHKLPIGNAIEAFIQANPSFRPSSGKKPVVLIGAGSGIGPLVGFIRNNKGHHPMHLYWGGRCPQSDFLYETELNTYLKDKRLTELNAVFSHDEKHSYVQDKISLDADELRKLIENGAQILVCGGRNMASSVMTALNDIIAPLGMDVATLKAQGRYREDVY